MGKTKHDSIAFTVVTAGAVQTILYPVGKSADDYLGGTDHILVTTSTRTLSALNGEFTLLFGLANMTLTLTTGMTFTAGQVLYLQLDRAGEFHLEDVALLSRMCEMKLARCLFGAVETAVANGVCASQALTAVALNALINGSLATASVATFVTPRNVVAAWTATAVLTVTGTDEYGNVLVESSASGVTFTGKKAFKTVTRVRVSADVTALTVGTGVILGLPAFLADVQDGLREMVDGVAPTAGVIVAADRTLPATALTGDIRGTWAPNAVPNAARVYELTTLVRALSYRGAAQFAG